jgi:uncharacterized protein DUF4258
VGIRRIRRAFREGHYVYSVHALEEMDDDQLSDSDVSQAVMQGKVVARLTGDSRGLRFVIRGLPASDGPEIEIVCRFLPSAVLRIITAYVVHD